MEHVSLFLPMRVQHSQIHTSQNKTTIKTGTSRHIIHPHNHGISCTLYDEKEFETQHWGEGLKLSSILISACTSTTLLLSLLNRFRNPLKISATIQIEIMLSEFKKATICTQLNHNLKGRICQDMSPSREKKKIHIQFVRVKIES